MSAMLLTPPATEPLTLAEAKLVLRVDHDDEDALISDLIAAARRHVEARTRRALVSQQWRLVRDAWPETGRITVSPSPLRAVIAARVHDRAGVAQPVAPACFTLDTASSPGVLVFAPFALIAPGRMAAGIEIDVEVGYGASASAVPAPLVQAVRMLVAHWYDHRGVVADGGAPSPEGVAALIAPYRVLAP